MDKGDLGPTSTGIKAEVSALLCYLGGFITGIIFYLVEKDNKFVRFHAIQSTVLFGGLFIINIAVKLILPYFMETILNFCIMLLSFILWVVMMYKSYKGEKLVIPIAGDVAEKRI